MKVVPEGCRRGILCLFLFFLASAPSAAQLLDASEYRNLDPRLRGLIVDAPEEHARRVPSRAHAGKARSPSVMGRNASGEALYSVIVHVSDPVRLRSAGFDVQSVIPGRATLRASIAQIRLLLTRPDVRFIESSGTEFPQNDISVMLTGAQALHDGYVGDTSFTGAGVLVGIIDTGIDWLHPDFRDPADTSRSRIAAIWDQTLEPNGGETSPFGFSYGVEYTRSQVENELDGTPDGLVRSLDAVGHGTSVAGTLAGNGGALESRKYKGSAPGAEILVVKAGNELFPTANVVDALAYLQQKAASLGKPIVVNMSLGTNEGAHDGSDAKSAAMDAFADVGRVVVASAGNSGASNIHVTGSVAGSSTAEVVFTVPAYSPVPDTWNDDLTFDFWFSDTTTVTAEIVAPTNAVLTQPAGGESTFFESFGTVNIFNFVWGENNLRRIVVDLYDDVPSEPPAAGTWKIRFVNLDTAGTTYHGWLYNNTIGAANAAVSPSGANSEYTLANTSTEAIIVGSYVQRWRWFSQPESTAQSYGIPDLSDGLAVLSSRGPTRTGGQKPDVAAPGQAVVTALSRTADMPPTSVVVTGLYQRSDGTSISSPVVAGCVALLMERDHALPAASALALLTSTARSDSFTGASLPDHRWGFGKVDVLRAMQKLINGSFPSTHTIYQYDGWGTDSVAGLTATEKAAVRFTASTSGNVVGALVHVSNAGSLTGPLTVEVWSDDGSGSPALHVGESWTLSAAAIAQNTWNAIPMTTEPAGVTAGQNFHLVVTVASGSSISLNTDIGTSDGRSAMYRSGQWQPLTADIRIRAIVVNDVTALPVEPSFAAAPAAYELSEPYPNPFNPRTSFTVSLPERSHVSLAIYDVLGRCVSLMQEDDLTSGEHTIGIEGTRFASGVYVCRMEAQGLFSGRRGVKVRKMVVLR